MLRGVDSLARVGSDEFVALIADCDSVAETDLIESRIQNATNQLNNTMGYHSKISCSIGWSNFPEDGDNLKQLLYVADQRMYQEKLRKKGSNNT